MKQGIFAVLSNRPLTRDVWEMKLRGDTSAITAPGQFVNIKIDGFFLRRPISVCDWGPDTLTLIYKVVGRGTAAMSAMLPGTTPPPPGAGPCCWAGEWGFRPSTGCART